MLELDGRTAWVTGSARNLGKAMVRDFARQGADVVVSNRKNDAELRETVEELRAEYDVDVTGVQLDIGDPADVDATVEVIHEDLGPVDILVNNAMIRPKQWFEDLELEEWEHVLRTNLTGPFLCTKAVFPDMRENGWGRVVNISGTDAYHGHINRLPVTTTKSGIIGFTRELAQIGAEHGITANCIVPGPFDIEAEKERYYSDVPEQWERREFIWEIKRQRIPLGRIGQPEELSPSVVFMASEEASFITGQVLLVNGGKFPTTTDPMRYDLDQERLREDVAHDE